MGGNNPSHDFERTVRKLLLQISQRFGYNLKNIGLHTSVNFDIGIDGDDAEELLLMIDANSEVDWQGFDFGTYFTDEGLLILSTLATLFISPVLILNCALRRFFPKYPRLHFNTVKSKQELSVMELAGAVYNRSWSKRHSVPELDPEIIERWKWKTIRHFEQLHSTE